MKQIVCYWRPRRKEWVAEVDTGSGKPMVYVLKWTEPGDEDKVLKTMKKEWKGHAVSIRRKVKHHPSLGG